MDRSVFEMVSGEIARHLGDMPYFLQETPEGVIAICGHDDVGQFFCPVFTKNLDGSPSNELDISIKFACEDFKDIKEGRKSAPPGPSQATLDSIGKRGKK